MSKKPSLDMAGLLATKGQGTPASDAPSRPVVTNARTDERTNRRIRQIQAVPSSEFVNLGFKVPREFRRNLRKIAADKDISLVEVLRQAVNMYEQKRP